MVENLPERLAGFLDHLLDAGVERVRGDAAVGFAGLLVGIGGGEERDGGDEN